MYGGCALLPHAEVNLFPLTASTPPPPPPSPAPVSVMDREGSLRASLSAVKCTEIMCQHFGSLISDISGKKRDLHFNAEGVVNLFKYNIQETIEARYDNRRK